MVEQFDQRCRHVPQHRCTHGPPSLARACAHSPIENKRARTTLPQSPTSPSKHADNPEASVLVPFSRPLVPFSCTTRGGQMESTLSDTTRGGHSSTTVREAVRMIYQRRTLLTNNNYTNLP